jgi:DNA primase
VYATRVDRGTYDVYNVDPLLIAEAYEGSSDLVAIVALDDRGLCMTSLDVEEATRLPVKDVAVRLGIRVLPGNKAMCFGGHDKLTPSLSFEVRKNYWHCFGCGLGGNPINLVKCFLGCDFRTALKWFADEFGVGTSLARGGWGHAPRRRASGFQEVPPPPARTTGGDSGDFAIDTELYTWLADRCGSVSQPVGLRYLKEHGISRHTADKFGVREIRSPVRALECLIRRWGKDRVHRSGLVWGTAERPTGLIWSSYTLLFPFYEGEDVSYLQGRLFRGDRKYVNPRGIPKPLYNVNRLKSVPEGRKVHICEGVPDALSLESIGLCAVGVLGASSFRPEWVEEFLPHKIAALPDRDAAGRRFNGRIKALFRARGKSVLTVAVRDGKDVAEAVAKMGRAT